MKHKILFILLTLFSTTSFAENTINFNIDNKSFEIIQDDFKVVIGFKCFDHKAVSEVKYAYTEKNNIRRYNTENVKRKITKGQLDVAYTFFCPKG